MIATPFLAAGLSLALQAAAAPYYEGVARDSFAAWSFTSGEIAIDGAVKTTSVQALYATPTNFGANPTPVAWSIHKVAFDCQTKTATYISGANYAQNGAMLYPANPAPATPWTSYTPGFQQLAATVCAMKAPL